MTDHNLRLFVAVELPDDVRRALQDTIDALRAAGATSGLRYVRPEGIHITLKFLGATPEGRVQTIATGLRLGVRGAAPFELQPQEIGTFHGRRHEPYAFGYLREAYPSNVRVVWVGLRGDTPPPSPEYPAFGTPHALTDLAERVESALNPLGFPRELDGHGNPRPFFAHLTMARLRDDSSREDRERLFHLLREFEAPPFPSFRVERVSLMQSTLQRGGAVYGALATFPLEGRAEDDQ